MDDLALARKRLETGGLSLVVVRDGRVLAESDEHGMAATLECLEAAKRSGPGSSLADKVVGQAAAWAAVWADCSACYGEVMSAPAASILRNYGVRAEASKRVEAVLDRYLKGLCPLEAAVADARSAEEAVGIIRRLTL